MIFQTQLDTFLDNVTLVEQEGLASRISKGPFWMDLIHSLDKLREQLKREGPRAMWGNTLPPVSKVLCGDNSPYLWLC